MNLTANHLVSGKAARGDASRQPRIHWSGHVLDERMVPVLVPVLVLLTFLVLVLPLCFALWPSRSCETKPAAPRRWEHKLRQRLWNGAGGVYDAFLIDVHLKKRECEWNASIQLGDAPVLQSSCHRQPGGSCNWAAVKGACNGRFLGPNCHFVCKFELWKCWAWKCQMAANNCWIHPSSSSRLSRRISCVQSCNDARNHWAEGKLRVAAA